MASTSTAPSAIDTAQIVLGDLPAREFPAASRFRISIDQETHDAVWAHARSSLTPADQPRGTIPEVGGVLLGGVYRDSTGPFVHISATIPAEHTLNEETQVTFTPETWEHINHVKDRKYGNLRIVGWYHTHPRFGVFLSDRDVFAHRCSFPQPWAVALVVDPVQEVEGFFVWSAGEPRLATDYWVGHDLRDRSFSRPAAVEGAPHTRTAAASPAPGYASPISRASFALATVSSFLALLLLFAYVYSREVQHAETDKRLFGLLQAQEQELAKAGNDLGELRQALVDQVARQRVDANKLNDGMLAVNRRLRTLAALTARLQLQVFGPPKAPENWQGEEFGDAAFRAGRDRPVMPGASSGAPAGQRPLRQPVGDRGGRHE